MNGPDYRFGTSELLADRNRVAVPQQLEAVGLAEQGEPMFWAYSSDKEAVMVSNRHELFKNKKFNILGQTTVGDNRITQVPQEASNFLNVGILYFIMSPALGSEMCIVLDEDEAQTRYEGI